jgi:hypothetical protein
VRGAWKICVETSQCQALTSIYFGLIFTASSRLLAPTKSVTQARRQFGRYLLFHIAMQALHPTGKEYDIAYWRHKVSAPCAPFFCHSEPKLATLKFLRRQKKLPPTAVNQTHPRFGRFSPSPFKRCSPPFLNRSVELNPRNLVA